MALIRQATSPISALRFSLRDVEAQAKTILDDARREAERIIEEARASVAAPPQAMEPVIPAPTADVQDAINALTSAAEMIPATIEQLAADLESDVAELALAIAERVAKRAGLIDPDVLANNVREAMKLVVRTGELRIAIHPSQIETINALLPTLKSEWLMLAGAEIVPDETVTPGGCRIATTHGQIDADLASQLDRIAAELLPDDRRAGGGVKHLQAQLEAVNAAMTIGVAGRVQAISGLTIEASDLQLPLGSTCRISSMGGRTSLAEVIGIQSDRTLLMPLSATAGVSRGDRVENIATSHRVYCSHKLLGRVLNGFGEPIDQKGPLPRTSVRRIDGTSVAPMHREPIHRSLATGVRAIDGLLTCGRGQRMGIFSGPGVGKSTLISSIARNTSADVSVVALIGERGHEVQQFLGHLGEEGLARSIVIVSTGDDAALLRVRAAQMATTIAEYFRDEGKDVLLVMDSLTRMCHAQRQIGLAAREPPATRGYPPSVFALIPQVLERAGSTPTGSITGFYTVLVEGDDFNEPISDAVKGITDGQLWLSRTLANRGHFPAIDVLQSISRVRESVVDDEHLKQARRILSLLAGYHEIEDLVSVGAYVEGVNRGFDVAVQARDSIVDFLKQQSGSAIAFDQTRRQLTELIKRIDDIERRLSRGANGR